MPVNPAETYERYMVPALFAPAAEHLLAVARLRPGERVLDIGTGTGIVARLAAPQVGPTGTVAGLDASPPMLKVARAMAAQEGLSIDWQKGRAEALPYPDESFDLVFCQFALMFFTDRAGALSEMRRVLIPGGRVALGVFQGIDRHPFYEALDQAIERHLGMSPVGAIFALGDANALGHHSRVRASAAWWSSPSRSPRAFRIRTHSSPVRSTSIPRRSRPCRVSTPTARRDLVTAIQRDGGTLRTVTVGDAVHLPFHVLIVRACR